MLTKADKMRENTSQPVANEVSRKQPVGKSVFQFTDNRPQFRQAAQLQALAAHYTTQQKPVIQRKENVVQRYGAIRFANLDTAQAKYRTKANDIIAALQATPNIQGFLAHKNTLITLETDPQLASVRIVGDQVQITLSPWFFEQESRGRILGMLAHEFGVHPLARAAMSGAEQTQEDQDYANNIPFPTGIPGHTVTPQQAGQRDHVFAAVAGQPRFNAYVQTVHQMVGAMFHQTTLAGATMTEAHVTDAIMTYLSDIAMILATNDHRGQIVGQPQRTADCFNLERARWLNYLTGKAHAADLTRLTPPVKTRGDVLNEVRSLAGSFILSIFTGSADHSKLAQSGPGGILNPLTDVQQGVLTDYGLALQPKTPAQPDIFEAYDEARGNALGTANVAALARLGNLHAGQAGYETRIAVEQGALPAEVPGDMINAIAWALQARIRVIQPNGKILHYASYGGPQVTLLYVPKPAPHYRFAL